MNVKKQRTNVAREILKRPDITNLLNGNKPLNELFKLPSPLLKERVELYRRLYFEVGSTGLYRLLLPNQNKLFIKMEYANAMGNTHYARFWLVYLYIAEMLGVIDPDHSKLIEVTSGSSGIALSMAAERLGYKVSILVPDILPDKRIDPMSREGVSIIKVKGYINECILKLREMIEQEDFFATNHSEEKADIIVKVFTRIAQEALDEIKEVDYGILGMGNGTSTLAIAEKLKSHSHATKIISYRPDIDKSPEDIVFGLIGANIECRHIPLAEKFVDKMVLTTGISLEEVRERYQYDTEVSNMGYSSLFGIHIAHQISKNVENKIFLSVGYDKIDRY